MIFLQTLGYYASIAIQVGILMVEYAHMQLTKVEISGRRWYKGPDGRLYPSASSVLEVLFPDSKKWISEDALERGRICHEEMAKAMLSLVEGTIYQMHPDPEVAIRIASMVSHLSKFQFEIMAIEAPSLYLDIGLTPDLLVKEQHPEGGWIKHLYDYKFAEAMDESYWFQVELYGRAEEAQKVTLLQCNRKGEVFPHRVRPEAERWELIKSAINVRHHIDKGVKRHV